MSRALREGLAGLAEEVEFVDLHERVLRGSRRITVRNRTVASVAAFVALSGTAIGVTAVRPSPDDPFPPASVSPMPSESPTPSPTPSATQSVQLPNVDIRNATFDVPAFPGDTPCRTAATRTFKDGWATVGGGIDGEAKLHMVDAPVKADVDGIPGEEILTRLHCVDYTSPGQVLAIKVGPDGKLSPLGFVMMSPDHVGFEVVTNSLRTEGGNVLVDVLSPTRPDGPLMLLDLQTRGYAYRDGKFAQVSGPVKFSLPPADFKKLDLRNVTIGIKAPSGASGLCRVVEGRCSVSISGLRYDATVVSSVIFQVESPVLGTPDAAVLFRLRPAQGPTLTFINVYTLKPVAIPSGDIGVIADVGNATKVEEDRHNIRVTVNGAPRFYAKSYPFHVIPSPS